MDALNKQYSEYALGMANTSYNIETGLVVAGHQLSFQDDVSLMQLPNAIAMNIQAPAGFTIGNVYKAA